MRFIENAGRERRPRRIGFYSPSDPAEEQRFLEK
jgi:hypothetical protein